MLHTAAFGIGSAEIQTPDTRQGNSGGTHRTRLQRHVEIAVRQPHAFTREYLRTGPQYEHLGMRCRVVRRLHAIAVGSQDLAIRTGEHSPDRHLPALCGVTRLAQGQVHMA